MILRGKQYGQYFMYVKRMQNSIFTNSEKIRTKCLLKHLQVWNGTLMKRTTEWNSTSLSTKSYNFGQISNIIPFNI